MKETKVLQVLKLPEQFIFGVRRKKGSILSEWEWERGRSGSLQASICFGLEVVMVLQ